MEISCLYLPKPLEDKGAIAKVSSMTQKLHQYHHNALIIYQSVDSGFIPVLEFFFANLIGGGRGGQHSDLSSCTAGCPAGCRLLRLVIATSLKISFIQVSLASSSLQYSEIGLFEAVLEDFRGVICFLGD
jgi:hypothetical protein